MTKGEFVHFMDQWHLAERHSSCTPDPEGLIDLVTGAGIACAALLLPSGEVEIFACPGYADAQSLQALAEESCDPDHGSALDSLCCWKRWLTEDDEWSVALRLTDGLAVLARIAAPPLSVNEWNEALDRFDAVYARWSQQLSATPA